MGRRSGRVSRAVAWGALVAIGAGGASCTSVNPSAVRAKRESGVTKRYDRAAPDVYQASVAAIEQIRVDHPLFSGLEVVEKDPATGTVIAEQRLDSAIIPGLGEKDAVGIFVAEGPGGTSEVTVVALASDQIPGDVGTYMASLNGAESRVFPAIDSALAAIPESAPVVSDADNGSIRAAAPPRSVGTPAAATAPAAVAAPASAAPIAPAAATQIARTSPSAPSAAAAAESIARRDTALDRVYDLLRASSAWRPLVRETRDDGTEEVRVGRFATITETSGGLRLAVRDGSGVAADAARLALDLERAGFKVDVVSERASAPSR
jgi:hypothetical protein